MMAANSRHGARGQIRFRRLPFFLKHPNLHYPRMNISIMLSISFSLALFNMAQLKGLFGWLVTRRDRAVEAQAPSEVKNPDKKHREISQRSLQKEGGRLVAQLKGDGTREANEELAA
jgi:hypothetical protein